MSETILQYNLTIDGIATDAASVLLEDPTGAYGVRRTDTLAVVVAAGTPMVHQGTGYYDYTFTNPADGITYQYWLKITYVTGIITYIEQTKSAPTPIPTPSTVIPGIGSMPLLPLDTFRQILGYNPWHFWGFATDGNGLAPIHSDCNDLVTEFAYQNQDQAGRDEIREAILNAEARLLGYLEYEVAPRYKEITLPYPTYFNKQFWNLTPQDASGKWTSVMLPEGYVQALGVESLSLLDTVAVTYSAQIPSGLNDTFTISVSTDETDPSKIAVYFAAADRLDNESVSERWRIQPDQVSIESGTATIRGRAWLLGKPINYLSYSNPFTPLDPTDSANFVSTLEIYVRTTDPDGQTVDTSQGEFIWNTLPYPPWATCLSANSVTDAAAQAYALARVGIRDAKNGIVLPGQAVYNSTTETWSEPYPGLWTNYRPPDRVTVRYLAGYPLQTNGQMDPRLQRCVARLAMAVLPERISACDVANRELTRWQQDIARIGTTTEQYAISRKNITNPFGTRRGEIYAWNELIDLRLVRGASAG